MFNINVQWTKKRLGSNAQVSNTYIIISFYVFQGCWKLAKTVLNKTNRHNKLVYFLRYFNNKSHPKCNDGRPISRDAFSSKCQYATTIFLLESYCLLLSRVDCLNFWFYFTYTRVKKMRLHYNNYDVVILLYLKLSNSRTRFKNVIMCGFRIRCYSFLSRELLRKHGRSNTTISLMILIAEHDYYCSYNLSYTDILFSIKIIFFAN